jgi:hypothetical protein
VFTVLSYGLPGLLTFMGRCGHAISWTYVKFIAGLLVRGVLRPTYLGYGGDIGLALAAWLQVTAAAGLRAAFGAGHVLRCGVSCFRHDFAAHRRPALGIGLLWSQVVNGARIFGAPAPISDRM